MSVEITKDIQKLTWTSNSYRFGEYTDKWGEAGIATIHINITENISVATKASKHSVKTFVEEPFILEDDFSKVFHKIIPCNIALSDEMTSRKVTIRTFYESFALQENVSKHSVLAPFNESFILNDAIIRASEGVLSDLHIINTPIDFDKFVEMAQSPALYNPFMDFKVGEYEYKDAIVKVKLSTTTQETFPSLVNCTMHVDIPDTDDRGTVEITDANAPTKVYFNKFYYNPPEVIVVLRGGNTADGMVTPNIVSTDLSDNEGRYFEVELLDSYGVRKTGSISWTSKGY
jgi:hypothetical protein